MLTKEIVKPVIKRQKKISSSVKSSHKKNGVVHPRNKLNDLTGKEWIQETSTIWYQRGLGANHKFAQIEKQHPAPFPYSMIERLVKFFTKKDAIVLDPFCGVSSTLKACALTNRKGVGIELSDTWIKLSKKRMKEEVPDASNQQIIKGDARKVLDKFKKDYFDFIVTSPPYWQILNKKPDHKIKHERLTNNLATNYSNDKNDLGNIKEYDRFLKEIKVVFQKCFHLLKEGKFMVVVVSDIRHKSKYIAYHNDTAKIMEDCGFETKSMSILVQNAKKLYPYGYPYDFVPNIHHQFILIFRKPKSVKK